VAHKRNMHKMSEPQQSTLAIVYDFDGTLTPQPMQEYTVLPELGISAAKFWDLVDKEVIRTGGDPILTYMRLLVEQIEANKAHLSREALRNLATEIKYYPGVDEWFDRINSYVKESSKGLIKIKHYIVSAGLSEILEGISIKKYFSQIYASQYYFDHHEAARFPTIVINDTAKTQYLFKINKGREEPLETINEYMPEEERPVPFQNMLYIGDGLTDVPCMTVVKNYGGFAVAVHRPRSKAAITACQKLTSADRIDFYAPADYRAGSKLENRVKKIIDLMIARSLFEQERKSFLKKIRK
jgi:2-hydroxy-3-keto-5-methylthiopentenyl-1-phosphate phosphatase